MRKYLNVCNLYTVAWMLYSAQRVLYGEGTIISQLLLLGLMVYGLYSFYELNRKKPVPLFFKGLNLFFIVLVVYGTLYILFGQTYFRGGVTSNAIHRISFLKVILSSILPLYAYYNFSLKGYISDKWIRYCFVFLLMITTANYYQHHQEQLLEAISGREEFTSNVGYDFLSLMPFLVFFKKKPLIQITLLAYISYFLLMAMKRGAIVIGAICAIYFFISSIRNSRGKMRYLMLALFAGFIFAGIYEFNVFMNSSDYFLYRLEQTLEGQTSGRDVIYTSLLKSYWYDSNLFSALFGKGIYATIGVAGNVAHQDWLELLTNCGLLGVLAYAIFYLCFYKSVKCVNNIVLRTSLIMAFAILFVKSLFSMGYECIGMEQGLIIGFCLAFNQREKLGLDRLSID